MDNMEARCLHRASLLCLCRLRSTSPASEGKSLVKKTTGGGTDLAASVHPPVLEDALLLMVEDGSRQRLYRVFCKSVEADRKSRERDESFA